MSRLAFLATSVLWLSLPALLRAEVPLYDQEPYDEVTLDAANGNEVVQIPIFGADRDHFSDELLDLFACLSACAQGH